MENNERVLPEELSEALKFATRSATEENTLSTGTFCLSTGKVLTFKPLTLKQADAYTVGTRDRDGEAIYQAVLDSINNGGADMTMDEFCGVVTVLEFPEMQKIMHEVSGMASGEAEANQ